MRKTYGKRVRSKKNDNQVRSKRANFFNVRYATVLQMYLDVRT